MATLAPTRFPAAARSLRWWDALAAAILVAAIAQQLRIGVDSDVSWLLTVGERVLDGGRLYVDIIETNPPASVLIYLPGILLARAVGVPSEAGTVAAVLLLAVAAIALAGRVLVRGQAATPAALPPLRAAAVAVLLLAPAACFAQREHVALLALLPFLAVAVARARRGAVATGDALLAGLGLGLTVAVKPHFALAAAPAALWAAWRARSWRPLLAPECVAAAALLLGYVVAVLVWFRPFVTDSMPVLALAYLPMRVSLPLLLEKTSVLIAACAGAIALRLGGRRDGVVVPLLAAIGFLLAAVIQGKGYLNHYLPVTAGALLALAAAVATPARDDRRLAAAALLVLALAATRCFAALLGEPGLEEAARRVAPPHPRVVLAGPNPGVGHPLVRQLGGRWVQRPHSLWLTESVAERLAPGAPPLPSAERARLRQLAAADAAMFAADVDTGRPDLVLVDGDASAVWIAATPMVARALAPYREAARAGAVQLWVRWKP